MSLGTRINKGLTYNALTCDEISIDNIENVADSMISPSCALFNVSACETTPVEIYRMRHKPHEGRDSLRGHRFNGKPDVFKGDTFA